MKRAQFVALVGLLAMSIVSCGNDPTKQPAYGRKAVSQGQPKVFFNNEVFTLKTGEEFQGSNFELQKDGNAKIILFGNDGKELYESLQIAPEDFAGDENLKPQDRHYKKGLIKQGENFRCTSRPVIDNVPRTEFKCQIGLEAWWGKTAGWNNSADSGLAPFQHFMWGPDASKAKVQTGFNGWALGLNPAKDGRYLGHVLLTGAEARMLYAATAGVKPHKVKNKDGQQVAESVLGQAYVCVKNFEGADQVSYSCVLGIDYQRGSVLASGDLAKLMPEVVPANYK